MWNAKTKVTPVITGATGTISNPSENTLPAYRESMKSRKYRKQLYWASTHT
jgi:hypothetical protein